jgi:hypothetical protein
MTGLKKPAILIELSGKKMVKKTSEMFIGHRLHALFMHCKLKITYVFYLENYSILGKLMRC